MIDDTVIKMLLYITFTVLITVYNTYSVLTHEIAECYELGTQKNSMGQLIRNNTTLQCKCLPHVTGLICNRCENGYYNIFSMRGCISCQCNPEGTKANYLCDSKGKCQCKDGYYGYRCEKRDKTCICSTLFENLTQVLRTEIEKLNTTINTPLISFSNNTLEKFNKQLAILQNHIAKFQYQKDISINSDQDQVAKSIDDIQKHVTTLILKLLQYNATDIKLATSTYELVLNDLESCKEKIKEAEMLSNNLQHNEDITLLSRNARNLIEDLLNVIRIFREIENRYNSTKEDIEKIIKNTTDINNKYSENLINLSAIKNLTNITSSKSRKTKEFAISNQELLSNLHLPTHNKSTFCMQEIPDYKNEIESTIVSYYENYYHQQNILEKFLNDLKTAENKASRLEKQKEKDNALLKAVYEQALTLIDKLDGRIAINILAVSDINEENENDLLKLQEELEHLIQKLEMFAYQLSELERISNKNLDVLENLQKQVNTSMKNLEKIKELDIIIGAVPISEEEMYTIEKEINKGDQYFQLLTQIKELEEEVNTLEIISSQLSNLPDNLCSADIHPEGVTLP